VFTAFYAKCIIYLEFVPDKQTVNSKFSKEGIKRLNALMHRVRHEFRKLSSGILSTIQRCIFLGFSLWFWRN
jgi:hypothetical protein